MKKLFIVTAIMVMSGCSTMTVKDVGQGMQTGGLASSVNNPLSLPIWGLGVLLEALSDLSSATEEKIKDPEPQPIKAE